MRLYYAPMADVRVWNPKDAAQDAAPRLHLLRKAAANLDAPDFGLSERELGELAPATRLGFDVWESVAQDVTSSELIEWVRFFTVAETRLAAFEAGAKSAVVPLARALRLRGDYPPSLTHWIKANSTNRFLPHGSLLDRLNR